MTDREKRPDCGCLDRDADLCAFSRRIGVPPPRQLEELRSAVDGWLDHMMEGGRSDCPCRKCHDQEAGVMDQVIFRVVRSALNLDIPKLRIHTAYLAHLLDETGDTKTAARLRLITDDSYEPLILCPCHDQEDGG